MDTRHAGLFVAATGNTRAINRQRFHSRRRQS